MKNLALPDIRQRGRWDCGIAAVCTAAFWHGVDTESHISRLEDLVQKHRGLTIRDMVAAVRRIFGDTPIHGPMTIEDLAHFTKTQRPVIALVRLGRDRSLHWVTVGGASKRYVWFTCPLDGPRRVTVAEWEQIHSHGYDTGIVPAGNRTPETPRTS